MRVVVDTNILVSALLTPQGDPARILDLITSGQLTLLVDERILYEYREVLRRKKFGFDEGLVDDLIAFLDRFGELIHAAPLSLKLPDPDDLPFLEVATSGKVEFLITGNAKDYGKSHGIPKIIGPREFLKLLPQL